MPRGILFIIILIGLLVHFLICAGLSAYVANEKGYKGVYWFFIGLFAGIHGLIASAGLPDKFYDEIYDEDELVENEKTA